MAATHANSGDRLNATVNLALAKTMFDRAAFGAHADAELARQHPAYHRKWSTVDDVEAFGLLLGLAPEYIANKLRWARDGSKVARHGGEQE